MILTDTELKVLIDKARAEGKDLYQLAAAHKYSKPYGHVTVSERAAAKKDLFFHPYWGTPFKCEGITSGRLKSNRAFAVPRPKPPEEIPEGANWSKIAKDVGIEAFLKAGGRLYIDGDPAVKHSGSRDGLQDKDILEAEMFSIFRNFKDLVAVNSLPNAWDIFFTSVPNAAVEKIVEDGCIKWLPIVPMSDDKCAPEDFDDVDAALQYLNEGGVLIKLPDTPDSKYWRLFLMEPVPERFEDVIEDWKQRHGGGP